MAAAEEAERAEALRAESAEAALAVARGELAAARDRAAELSKLEARYWHDFNDFQLQLRAHCDERDVLLRKARPLPLANGTAANHCFDQMVGVPTVWLPLWPSAALADV